MQTETSTAEAQLGLLPCNIGRMNTCTRCETFLDILIKDLKNSLRERGQYGTSKMDKFIVSTTKPEEYQSHLGVDLPNIL